MIAFLLVGGLSVFLSPNDACVSAIVQEVGRARTEVFVQATGLTMPDVLTAFAAATERGVKVTVDTSHAGAGTMIIIDRRTVIAGSLRLAPRAVGSLFVVRGDSDIALKFTAAMVDHRGHAKAYAPSLFSQPAATKLAAKAASCKTCGDTKLITCDHCNGNWARIDLTLFCEDKRGTGCDGRGFRRCFRCRGDSTLECAQCKGRATVGRKERYTKPGGTRGRRTVQKPCPACKSPKSPYNPTGRVDCPKCHELWLVQEQVDKPAKILGHTDPRQPPSYWRYAETHQTDHGRKFVGMLRCPKCKGRGEYSKKGTCPDCTKGRMSCPDCA